jgi:uncharacterized membrane protein
MSLLPRRYRWILLLSLALNLGLISYLVMRPVTHEYRGRGHSMVLPPPHVIARVLSAEGQQILDRVVSAHRAKIRPTLREFAAGRRAIQELLRGATLDRDALTEAFARLRQREQRTAEAVQQMLVELSVALPLVDRQKLAELLERRRGRDHDRRAERREQRRAQRAEQDAASRADPATPAADTESTDPPPQAEADA